MSHPLHAFVSRAPRSLASYARLRPQGKPGQGALGPAFGRRGNIPHGADLRDGAGRKHNDTKTWIGGHDGNQAGSAANWSPSGAPRPGDSLNVATGTLEIGGRVAGDTLHLNDQVLKDGPVTLDLNGNARVSIDGSRIPGDPLNINVHGTDFLDASGGFPAGATQRTVEINLAAHLFVTGSMSFGYGGSITGGAGSVLTNNGTINVGSANSSAYSDGTVSTFVGTLVFRGYHDNRSRPRAWCRRGRRCERRACIGVTHCGLLGRAAQRVTARSRPFGRRQA